MGSITEKNPRNKCEQTTKSLAIKNNHRGIAMLIDEMSKNQVYGLLLHFIVKSCYDGIIKLSCFKTNKKVFWFEVDNELSMSSSS